MKLRDFFLGNQSVILKASFYQLVQRFFLPEKVFQSKGVCENNFKLQSQIGNKFFEINETLRRVAVNYNWNTPRKL